MIFLLYDACKETPQTGVSPLLSAKTRLPPVRKNTHRDEKEEPKLQIKNLTITHKKDQRVLVKDFSLTLNPGDKAVMIGEEGNGKSTVLKWIADPALIEDYAEAEGERILIRERTGYLPQELPEEEREKTLREYFAESDIFYEKSPKELAKLARDLTVPEDFYYLEQEMGTLSGGEKIKAQMLRLLLSEPTLWLLDEPSNDIDIQSLEWMEQFILHTKAAVLFISHDEVLIENTANMVIHIEQLKRKTECRHTVAKMSYTDYRKHRDSVMQNQEALALSQRKEQKVKEEKLRRIMQKVEHDQAAISRQDPSGGRLLKKKMHTVKAMEHRFEREAEDLTDFPEEESPMFFKFGAASAMPAGKTVLDLELPELYAADNGRLLAKDIKLFVRGPQKVCILGRNGCGKSTLIRLIAGELLQRGDLRVQYMPQNYGDLLLEEQTPVDFLCGAGDKEERTRIRTYLGAMKYTADEMDHSIAALSGGQKAKILLLKLSLSDANVLILAEPSRNFSPLSGPVIRRMLQKFPGTVISISHDRKYIREVCDTVYELDASGLHRSYG